MKKISFNSDDGTKLTGILEFSTNPSLKCVILCHGFKTNRNEYGIYNSLSKNLTENGFNTFRFDFRAHGESDGIDYEMSLKGLVEDINAAIRLMTENEFTEISLLGGSFGASIAVMYSSVADTPIKSLILWYPVLNYHKSFEGKGSFRKENYENALRNGFSEIRSKTTGNVFKIGKSLFLEMNNTRPYEYLRNIHLPILFVHGTDDQSIPYNLSIKYSYFAKQPTLKIIQNGVHGFHHQNKQLEEAILHTIHFLKNS